MFDIPDVKVITVEKGADSADFRLVNLVQKGDIAVTQNFLFTGCFVIL